MKTRGSLWLAAVAACASGGRAIPPARFANVPPVFAVNDQQDTREPPRKREVTDGMFYFEGSVYRRLVRPLEVRRDERARGVNSLDEVPDSTWFTNRIGVRDLTLDELRRGPNVVGNPENFTPWVVHEIKHTGESLGFLITDSRGEKFIIKFDRRGFPETETANQMITGRLLWAAGYNTTDDYLAHVRAEDIVVAPDATRYELGGRTHRYTTAELAAALDTVERTRNGRLRVMASHFLDGKPIGGHAAEGVRADDPNDVIPHERRRDLRGALPLFAWLDHVDVKESNTMDMWTQDPHDPARHFVVHYFLDFGKSLGGMSLLAADPRRGNEYSVDPPKMYGSFVTLGLRPRTFEHRPYPDLRGIGLYDSVHYAPEQWRPSSPAYLPFLVADRYDWFWGAKIMMRFTPDQLRAVVDLGELSDPSSRAFLVNTLIARQRQTAAYAFSCVNPLDNFAIDDRAALCFDDLALSYQLTSAQTRYLVRSFDPRGGPIGASQIYEPTSGHTCTGPVDVSRDPVGYTIVEIETRRGRGGLRAYVHVARDPKTHGWRVIGIWRE
ncbi:MAG: hypothetical protein HOV81_06160 [Kofleriaceae bacterium]|nr:hypothetical protein [Kofleriaceae bacterium]